MDVNGVVIVGLVILDPINVIENIDVPDPNLARYVQNGKNKIINFYFVIRVNVEVKVNVPLNSFI